MGSQGPGRKRTTSKNGLTAEEDALNVIAKEAEARLAAKRAARAEAREIRMRELERQQKEEDSERYTRVSRRHASVSDDEERMSVGSRSNIRLDLDAAGAYGGVDDGLERDYLEKGSSRASTISGATLTSLGGTSSRRGSGDTSISADTEASIREIKDSLLELEEKYRKAMVSNAQLDNEKTNMMYEVDTLKDSLMELEEMLFETRRELEEKCKDLEREKHAHSILQFQFNELKETLKQSEELLTKHGIVLGPDLATNGETGEEVGKADQNSEIREGSSVLGTHQLKVCKDQQQKDLDDGVPGNQQLSHAQFSSSNTPLEASMENGELGDQMIQGVEELETRPEEPPSYVGDDELTATRPKEEIKSEAHILEDSRGNTVELGCNVYKDGHLETDQQERECVKPSQVIKEETPSELVSDSVHDETDKPGETVLDDKLNEEPVESSQTEKLAKTQGASASNKKKKKKKKNKQKQKLSDKQESYTKINDKNETVCSEDNPNQKTEGDLEGNHQDPLENDISETTMNTDVPHDAKRTSELDGIETSTNINADDAQDKILLVTDEADLAEISKTISNFDCPESGDSVISNDLSNNIMSNPANIIDEHTEVSTNPDSEAVIFSCELVSSETKTSLPHEPSVQSMDAVEGGVEYTSSSENTELKSASVDIKEVESHLNCEVEEQEEKLLNVDLDGTTNPEDQDDSAHPTSPVMEKVENEAERVIQEQPVDQPMENQFQDSIGAELDQEEVETQDGLDKENLKVPTEIVFDGSHVDNAPLIETQVQVVQEDHLSANEAIQESVGESDASDQKPEVEEDEEERSIQNQVTLEVQLPEDEEELLVKSDVAAQELKEEDEEEEDGESFDFDEMDIEASSDAPLKNFLDQPNEEVTLLKENVQEASQEHQSNVTDEDQTQEDEHLELADQESKPKEQKDDGQDTENPQTTTDVEGCLTEDSQINSEVRPNDQQHDITGIKEDAFEEHRQASEDVTLNEGVNLISEMETRNVGQEVNSTIHRISGDQDVEKETAESNREDERKESKKSGKGKGKGKGKEDCKMS